MSKQQSNARGEKSNVDKADTTRYGFEPIPATAEVGGATGGNEPDGRTAVEVTDFYTAEEMNQRTEEPDNTGKAPATNSGDVFNPVLDSVAEVTKA